MAKKQPVSERVSSLNAPHHDKTDAFSPLPPESVAAKAEGVGVKKADQPWLLMFGLAVLGGAFVALGGMFATITVSGAQGILPYGITKLVMGLAFSLGLILVVLAGAQLFTSDCLMVMAWASGRIRLRKMVRVWLTVWLGNFVGSVCTALLLFLSGQYAFGHGVVGDAALYIASAKATLPPNQVFFLAIFCNVLVCLAVWLSTAARTLTDKIIGIVFPVSAFVAAGFEHCVANMFFIPYGLMIKLGAPESFWEHIGKHSASVSIPVDQYLVNLGVATLGNWVGGALLVGAVYWCIYRRNAVVA